MSAIRHVTLHGHPVGYRRAGPGGPEDPSSGAEGTVVLIHGMAGSSNTWRAVMPRLARRFDVIAPDMLGHGESAKPVGDYSLGAHATGLRDLLVALDVRHATVVGQSLGGGVAMQLAYQYPDLCSRLVLVSSGGLGREVSPILRLLALPGAELVLPLIAPAFVRDRGNEVSTWIRDRGIRAPRVSELWRAYQSLAEPENRRAFVHTLRAVVDPGGQIVSALDRLYLAGVLPTLIVWGDRDTIIPMDHGLRAHGLIPGSRLEILEGVGHFPQVEAPDVFLDVFLDFVDTTEPAEVDEDHIRGLLAAVAG